MAINKSQRLGIVLVAGFLSGAVTLVKWEDWGVGWTLGAWGAWIAFVAIVGKVWEKRGQ